MNLNEPISSIMSTELKLAQPDDNAKLLDDYFRENRFHHIPVVDGRRLVGIVSKSDFLYLLRGFTGNEEDRFIEAARLRAYKVKEIMTDQVTTISQNEPIHEAARILAENRFRCLPILDESKEIVGIVTTHDIVKLVAQGNQ